MQEVAEAIADIIGAKKNGDINPDDIIEIVQEVAEAIADIIGAKKNGDINPDDIIEIVQEVIEAIIGNLANKTKKLFLSQWELCRNNLEFYYYINL